MGAGRSKISLFSRMNWAAKAAVKAAVMAPAFAATVAATLAATMTAMSVGISECLANLLDGHIQLLSYPNHSRLILWIDETVSTSVSNSKNGFELNLKGLGLMDLGAPVHEGSGWTSELEKLGDPRVESITATETSEGVRIRGRWKFPEGRAALADPKMEVLDFREKNPPHLVLDFWVKAGPTVGQKREQERLAEVKAVLERARLDERLRLAKKNAILTALEEEERKSKRYCSEPLSEENDLFLPFYPWHDDVDFSEFFKGATPDAEFPYFQPRKKTKEALYVRLALKLYRQNSFGLTLRTIQFFEGDFPNSEFQNEMLFLKANTYLKLNMRPEGEKVLNHLIAVAPDSPVALHSVIFLVRQLMEENQPMIASQKFLWLTRHYPDYELNWVFYLGLAECAYALRNTDGAAKHYRWVIENAPSNRLKAEAAIRLGDIYLHRFQYDRASGAYLQAESYFPQFVSEFPTFYLNWGEALYQLKSYDRARSVYAKYLNHFPSLDEGWRVTYRLGELEARTSPIGLSNPVARNWFLETINRFPMTPGATLARIRLLSCGDHGGFNGTSLERFFKVEARELLNREGIEDEIYLSQYNDMRALARLRVYSAIGKDEEINRIAMKEYKAAKNERVKKSLAMAANETFRKAILNRLSEDDDIGALSFYVKNIGKMPPQFSWNKTDYLYSLARSAAKAGLPKLSANIIAYKNEVKPKPDQKTVKETLDLAALGDVEASLQKSDQLFTEAKALWLSVKDRSKQEQKNDKYTEIIKKVSELLSQVKDESTFFYEKTIILGIISKMNGDSLKELDYVSKANLISKSSAVKAWLADAYLRNKNWESAVNLYRELENQLSENEGKHLDLSEESRTELLIGVPVCPSLEDVLFKLAAVYESKGLWGPAAATYSRAVDRKVGGVRSEYQYAVSLLKQGKRDESEKGLSVLDRVSKLEVKSIRDQFWKKLALETLETAREGEK